MKAVKITLFIIFTVVASFIASFLIGFSKVVVVSPSYKKDKNSFAVSLK